MVGGEGDRVVAATNQEMHKLNNNMRKVGHYLISSSLIFPSVVG